jgi:hypothetical protein
LILPCKEDDLVPKERERSMDIERRRRKFPNSKPRERKSYFK